MLDCTLSWMELDYAGRSKSLDGNGDGMDTVGRSSARVQCSPKRCREVQPFLRVDN